MILLLLVSFSYVVLDHVDCSNDPIALLDMSILLVISPEGTFLRL